MPLTFYSKDITPVIPNGTGNFQLWSAVGTWEPEDIWITGWTTIVYPYPGIDPVPFDFMMFAVSNGTTDLYNFGMSPDTTNNFSFPDGLGIFLPAGSTLKHYGQVSNMVTPNPGFVAFTTFHYVKDRDVKSSGISMTALKTKTFSKATTVPVDFIILNQPWESQQFTLLGVEMAVIGPHRQGSVCNSVRPDIILNWAYPKRGGRYFFPRNSGIVFPGFNPDADMHLDCHVDNWPAPVVQAYTAWQIPYYVMGQYAWPST